MMGIVLTAVAAGALAAPTLPAGYLRVPTVRQATEYTCGAAALQAVLAYWGVYDGGESGLAKRLGSDPVDGTRVAAMLKVARELGLEAEAKEKMTVDDLRAAVGRGDTVIVNLQAWADWQTKKPPVRGAVWGQRWEDGHYVVLVGMDAENAYFMDPSVLPGRAWVPLDELPHRWHDYERDGKSVRRYERLGIVVRGKAPANPPVLSRMD